MTGPETCPPCDLTLGRRYVRISACAISRLHMVTPLGPNNKKPRPYLRRSRPSEGRNRYRDQPTSIVPKALRDDGFYPRVIVDRQHFTLASVSDLLSVLLQSLRCDMMSRWFDVISTPDNVGGYEHGVRPIPNGDRCGRGVSGSPPRYVISASFFSMDQQHGGTRTWQQVRCFGSIR